MDSWFRSKTFMGWMETLAGFRMVSGSPSLSCMTASPYSFTNPYKVQDVAFAFGSMADQTVQVSMPLNKTVPGAPDRYSHNAFAGKYSAVFSPSEFPQTSLLGVSRAVKLSMTATNITGLTVYYRAPNTFCGTVGMRPLAGGFRGLRYLEEGFVSSISSAPWECPNPSLNTDPYCGGSFVASKYELFEQDFAWHTAPWSICDGAGNQTRGVHCRTLYGAIVSESKCSGSKPAQVRSCTPGSVSVPVSLSGEWVIAFHTLDAWTASGNAHSLQPFHSQAVVLATVTIALNASAASAALTGAGLTAPNSSLPVLVFQQSASLFVDPVRDSAASAALLAAEGSLNYTSLANANYSSSPTLRSKATAFVARLHDLGDGTDGWIQGHTAASDAQELAASGGAPFALRYSTSEAVAGATSGIAPSTSTLSVVYTPELPASARAFAVAGRAARGRNSSDAVAQAFLSPQTSVMTGKMTRGPVSYLQQPLGACLYDSAANACVRRRPTATCRNGANVAVDRIFCSSQPPPSGTNEQSCSGCLRWDVGGFGSCSKPCASGTRSRTVQCLNLANTTVSDSQCVSYLGPKPATSESCNTHQCAGYRTEPWGDCSTACGVGVQTRLVTCNDITGPVAESRCEVEVATFATQGRPNTTQACNNCPCENPSRTLLPHSRLSQVFNASTVSWNLTFANQAQAVFTAASFCPAGYELMTRSQWRCYTRAIQASMCTSLNAASGQNILPVAFKAEPSESLRVPQFLNSGLWTGQPDVARVRGDSSCSFYNYDNLDTAFVDPARQSAIGACRKIVVV
jgi:hypothetical protein